ncbi:MAG: HlyD family efflux transporter periplasmic adaptor subunit [Pseudonocardia sp.]|nr:HlyD family efflux transporter periplasmic adaptor subunit [Pseudonocardia sp.]
MSLLEAAGFAGTYFLYTRHYVSTDNAQVDGDRISINAPATGSVVAWSIDQGSTVRAREVVGRIRPTGGGPQPEQVIRAPGAGTIAVNEVVNGSYVTQGTELATAYDPEDIYVTARVKDTDIADVHPDALVDISVDAYPNIPMLGIVQVVRNSAASNFTIYPPAGADPSSPSKVDQYVPVKIALFNTGGAALLPGMNVTVHIHKQ